MVEVKKEDLTKTGYLHREIDLTLDLFEEIEKLKKLNHAVILAHYYQDSDIQDIADYRGDSLGLAQQAERTEAKMIVFAGVHFMAETAKLLNPHKKVVLPDLRAGCSLADSCPPDEFRKFKDQHPNYVVISYINCTADIKAMSDIICTSSNAVQIVESVPADKEIIFAPDKNLGAYIQKKTGRKMLLWNGTCMVHEIFSLDKIRKLRAIHPDAKVIAHPECEDHVLKESDFIGSTTALLNFTKSDHNDSFIVVTEPGIIHQMQLASPHKTFIPAPPENSCACNECPHMKLNTLEKLYLCMKYGAPEIIIPDDLAAKAILPLKRMLEISARHQL